MASLDVGIYFGGSSMSVAYFKDNSPFIIVNETGDRTTPSVISITDHETLIGTHAKQNMIRNSKNTVSFMKHFICKSTSDASPELTKKLDCEIKDSGANEISFVLEKNGKPFEMKLSETIQTLLVYLLELSKSSQGAKECNAVLSVPIDFTEQQSNFLKTCAQKAGFNVYRMITNPMGACLAYNLEEDNSNDSLVLVYQMGGNSIEVSLVQLSNGLYRYVDTVKVENVGGDLFTDIVVEILCEEFQRKHKVSPKGNKRSMFKLKANAEELKSILSTMERAHCSIDALFEGIDFDYYLTRQRLENSSSKCYQQVLQPIDDLLKRNGLAEPQIDQVILAGAPTQMCKIQSLIKEKFASAKLLCNQWPDEIVALGCAKQCALITNSKIKTISNQDLIFKCLPNPIHLQIGDGPNKQLVFKAKTPIPLKKSVSLDLDLQKPYILIFESENKFIAKIDVAKFTTKEVTVLFQIKMDETIEVTAKEASTGEKISVFLNAENVEE